MSEQKQAAAPQTVTLSKEQFDALIGRVQSLEEKSKGGIETAALRIGKNFQERMKNPDQNLEQVNTIMVDEPAEIGSVMLHDKCPFCIKMHKGKQTILDLTNGGKYSCRRCGKHWAPWAIFPEDGSDGPLEYNVLLERNGGEKPEYEAWKKLKDAKAGLPVANEVI